jgi:SOS-response transcriptional repressors (RecA-mediated autopeptidases)
LDSDELKKTMAKNLRFQLDRKGMQQTDLASKLSIPEMTVSNWLTAKTYPRMDKIQLIADFFHIRKSDLTEDIPDNLIEYGPQTVPVPVLGEIACGDPIFIEENHSEYRYESPDMLPAGNVAYLYAKGDSMEPTIPNGSLVLISEQDDVESGEIAAVLVDGNTEATLKRVKKQGNQVILVPDNPKHNPIIVTKDNPVKIIGKAIRYTRDL